MPKQWFQKLADRSDAIRHSKKLGPLRHYIQDPNLWHLNRHSVARAFFVAFFTSITLMIFPCHTITAAFLAVWLRANLPIAVSLVWLVNPITIPPLAYTAIKIGLIEMPSEHTHSVKQLLHFDWHGGESITETMQSFWYLFERIWEPFMLGSFTLGLLIGGFCYLAVQSFWRWHVASRWRKRRQLRLIQTQRL